MANHEIVAFDESTGQFKAPTSSDTGTVAGKAQVALGAAVGGATPGSGGLAFPATAVAVADANTLDDYEEGTWTPVLSDGTNNATSSAAVGIYTKIGNKVWIQLALGTSSLGSVSGDIRITGLPFVVNATNNYQGDAQCNYAEGLAITAGASVVGTLEVGTSFMRLRTFGATTGTVNMTAAEWSADGLAVMGGHYTI